MKISPKLEGQKLTLVKKKRIPNITSNNISRSIFTNRFPKLGISLNKKNTQLNPNIT